jgi:regulator of vacuolar morphogenesis
MVNVWAARCSTTLCLAVMTAIQAVFVPGHEERSHPKPHTVFRIEIKANVRSWQIWRRYSEFADLHTELVKSTGSAPPHPLPPKQSFSMLRSRGGEKMLDDRRRGLEMYLRAIISSTDDRWREHIAFREFLGVPVGRQTKSQDAHPTRFTVSSWLDEHLDLQSCIRDVRADINKRVTLSDRGDVNGALKANMSAKQKLAGVLTRIGRLGEGLREQGISDGEMQRRTDMVARLQDDCEKLGQMVSRVNLPATSSPSEASSRQRHVTLRSDKEELLGGASTSKPIMRVFGAAQATAPQETNETRPLDDRGVLQLQLAQMEEQDAQVTQLATILRRQRQLGEAIGAEIDLQNEMLDDLTTNVDRFGGKLAAAKKDLNRVG